MIFMIIGGLLVFALVAFVGAVLLAFNEERTQKQAAPRAPMAYAAFGDRSVPGSTAQSQPVSAASRSLVSLLISWDR